MACVIMELRNTMNTPIRAFVPKYLARNGYCDREENDGELDDEVDMLYFFKDTFLILTGLLYRKAIWIGYHSFKTNSH